MRLLIHKNYNKLAGWVADYIVNRIRSFSPSKDNPFILGLPTGSSPVGVYKEFIRLHREGKISFVDVVTFNMDEYVGLPEDHPESYHTFMKNNLFASIDIQQKNIHILNGMAPDLEKECESYEDSIVSFGGVELFLGGIGENGHIAFNEPGSSLASRTRVKTLSMDTRMVNARFFGGSAEKVPAKALTVGVGTVMDAKEVVIIVSGPKKARALRDAVEGGISHWCPLSCLQTHPKAIIACDEDAAGELMAGTVKYFKDIENENI